MSENPYQPPVENPVHEVEPAPAHVLYVVSKKKMVTLSVITLGIYLIYWFYRNWRLHKTATGESLWPLPRAIFSVFFVHSLFRVANDRRPPDAEPWNHSMHATITVFSLLLSNGLDRAAGRSIGSPVTDYLSLLAIIPVVTSLAAAQGRINEACGDPLGESNSRFTVANWIWIVLGSLFWTLVALGLFFPEVGDIE